MERNLKIALGQIDVIESDYVGNIKRAETMITDAAAKGTEIICFPEFFSTGIPPLPEPENGKTITTMRSCAQKNKIDIIAGTIVEERDGKNYNVSYYINKDGEILGRHDKTHLFFMEKPYRTAGDKITIIDNGEAKIGIVICWELNFPEFIRCYALAGAELVFCPTWVEDWKEGIDGVAEERRRISLTRAAENQFYFADVNAAGYTDSNTETGRMRMAGHSTVASPGPMSQVVAKGDYEGKLILADIDLDLIRKKREFLPLLSNRRPEMYRELSK
jgi:predicted amidohydrolase